MGFNYIVRLFEKYSVNVSGSKGSGKDVVIANVIARRKKPYISNCDYKCKKSQYYPWEYAKLDVGGNTYLDFINGTLKPYEFPYPDGTDIYLSDSGVYFPSQYDYDLDKRFKNFPIFLALSRQLGDCYVHTNSQDPERPWKKIREMQDYFLRLRWTKVIFGKICITYLTEYDKRQACIENVRPCRIRVPWRDKNAKMQARIYRDNFYNQHGKVKNHLFIYLHKSKYDTRLFKEMLKNAKEN